MLFERCCSVAARDRLIVVPSSSDYVIRKDCVKCEMRCATVRGSKGFSQGRKNFAGLSLVSKFREK